MPQSIPAIFEKGMLRPLAPLDLREQQRVSVTISPETAEEPWLDAEYHADCESAADQITLEEVRAALAKIPGSLTEDFRAEREER